MDTRSDEPTRPDSCFHCGYNLADLDTGICPECGAGFITGRDLGRLHDRLRSGTSTRCATCGTARADPGAARCPTCSMRYSSEPAGPETVVREKAGVRGIAAAPGPGRLSGAGGSAAVPPPPPPAILRTVGIAIAGIVCSGVVVILADRFGSALPGIVTILVKGAAVLFAFAIVAWMVVRLVGRGGGAGAAGEAAGKPLR